MIRRPWMWVAGLCLASLVGAAQGAELTSKAGKGLPSEEKKSCGTHGTEVQFVDTPSEAAKLAKKAGKLVLVLHVSGNFEDPKFL